MVEWFEKYVKILNWNLKLKEEEDEEEEKNVK